MAGKRYRDKNALTIYSRHYAHMSAMSLSIGKNTYQRLSSPALLVSLRLSVLQPWSWFLMVTASRARATRWCYFPQKLSTSSPSLFSIDGVCCAAFSCTRPCSTQWIMGHVTQPKCSETRRLLGEKSCRLFCNSEVPN